ncbi:MAG: cobalamin biosynthesis protein CbiD [Nitrospinae bacterium]|nr:cobalamin biosynthesis protein CbiD [Nitrospinota bacterium]
MLKTGFTTGACAAAGAKAACLLLSGDEVKDAVEIPLPDGGRMLVPVAESQLIGGAAIASVIKDAGDDPDITNGATVTARAEWNDRFELCGGEGVGTVTKKGLSVPPDEPAINPAPRRMIREAVLEVTDRPVKITIAIPGGAELAQKTFNPRLGIMGGLSILGTTGIVRPYSHPALKESLKCALDVAMANGVNHPVFTAGNIGTRSAKKLFRVSPEQVIEVGNEWGFMLDCARHHDIKGLLAVGHPGKLAKLANGDWDTHSSRSGNATPFVMAVTQRLFAGFHCESPTVEGIFESLSLENASLLGADLSRQIGEAIAKRANGGFPVAIALVNMKEELLGAWGDFSPWPSQ